MNPMNPYHPDHGDEPMAEIWDAGFAAGRAAATPDPPETVEAAVLAERARIARLLSSDEAAVAACGDLDNDNMAAAMHEWHDREFSGSAAAQAVIAKEVLRVAVALIPYYDEIPPPASPDERLREAGDLAPNEGVWPDQSAVHGVLLEQIKDAYAEGIADTVAKLRVRAAEMLPEVARFTLDEIEAIVGRTVNDE